ncbi:MAG: hypothetical protein LCH30_07195 [Proteobacteria bacterium]|nr:hypothetical protein [Pseudomonadota bacterium]
MALLKGKVVKVFIGKEAGDPYGFLLRDSDSQTYFAHVGDLAVNEYKLYKNKEYPTQFLEVGDEVEFDWYDPTIHRLAIHVTKKVN